MKTATRSLCIAALAALVPLSASAANMKPTSVKLHLSNRFMHTKAIMHSTGTAKLHWTKGDIGIKLTTDGLPAASQFGKRAYVLFATDGHMTTRVGALTAHGMMAGTSGMVMMTKLSDLYLYAESSADAKKPGNGVLVMSAMVG